MAMCSCTFPFEHCFDYGMGLFYVHIHILSTSPVWRHIDIHYEGRKEQRKYIYKINLAKVYLFVEFQTNIEKTHKVLK